MKTANYIDPMVTHNNLKMMNFIEPYSNKNYEELVREYKNKGYKINKVPVGISAHNDFEVVIIYKVNA